MSESVILEGIVLTPTILGPQDSAFNAPLQNTAASGSTNLETKQRGAVVGESIPIVFCRRVNNIGGVLISPPATESRFEDDGTTADITASYHLILSEGEIEPIQVRDVFQRSCRVGTFTQTYDRRAGTFAPGNFIDNTPDLEISSYCGTGGTYAGMSTMSFSVTIPAGFDQWNRQVHCFVRGGIYVPRLLDNVTGPSNNVADLLLYLFRVSSSVPDAMIDMVSLTAAATFTNVNSFFFNGVIRESTNLRDWMANVLPYFLLRQTRISGKEGLQPLLPTNSNGTIKTTAVTWVFTFTETHIIPGSIEIVYTPLLERKAFCAQILWRQQDDFGIPLIRTAEVRYQNFAIDGPYEQFDLSNFCSSENHAVKIGAYMLAKRRHVSHRMKIGVRPDGYNTSLSAGALVRVKLELVPSEGVADTHDYLYEVDRITKSATGEVTLELTHFPVNGNLESLIAIDVAAAAGSGDTLDTGLSAITCDINSDIDTDVPTEEFDDTPPTLPEEDVAIPDPASPNSDSGSGDYGDFEDGGLDGVADDEASNPGSESGGQITLSTDGDDINSPGVGDTITAPTICAGGQIFFYRKDPSVPGGKVQVAQATHTYTMKINDIDKSVYAEIICPDPTSPTGFASPVSTKSTGTVTQFGFDPKLYDRWRIRRSDGNVTDWYSTANYAAAFRTVDINGVSPRNLLVKWSAGATICFTGKFIRGFVGAVYRIAADATTTSGGTTLINYQISGGSVLLGQNQPTATYCSENGAGVFEFAFIENPDMVVREWDGVTINPDVDQSGSLSVP